MASGTTIRAGLAVTIILSVLCSWRLGERWALAPVLVLCSAGWYIHLPARRRRLTGFLRYTSLVVAQLSWAVLLGWLLDNALEYLTSVRLPVPFAFAVPFVVPVLHVFFPGAGALVFHVLLDVPFMLVVAGYHFLYGEKLNSLATPLTRNILLGSLPFASDVATLKQMGVTHVINMCKEWRGPVTQYDDAGIEQLRLPTTDGFCPSKRDMLAGCAFIKEALRENPHAKVFIHCRFGMGRSASMAVVALVADGWNPNKALDHAKALRPEVTRTLLRYPDVRRAIEHIGATRS